MQRIYLFNCYLEVDKTTSVSQQTIKVLLLTTCLIVVLDT